MCFNSNIVIQCNSNLLNIHFSKLNHVNFSFQENEAEDDEQTKHFKFKIETCSQSSLEAEYKQNFSSILWSYLAHFLAHALKMKKSTSKKKLLYFMKLNFLAPILKSFRKQKPPQNSLYFRKQKPQKNF